MTNEERAREIEEPYIHKNKPYERLYTFDEKREQIINALTQVRDEAFEEAVTVTKEFTLNPLISGLIAQAIEALKEGGK